MNANHSVNRIPNLYKRARQLRKEMTPAERILWRELRNRRFAGLKFRRQQPIDYYIADFFCAAARVVIELDGDSHMGKEARDVARQAYIESHDLRVIRFWNSEVYDALEWVLDSIAWVLDDQLAKRATGVLPSPREAGFLPSPLAGEGGGASPPGEGSSLHGA